MNGSSVPSLLGAVLLLALGAAEATAQQSAADQLEALDRQWSQAFQDGDIDWIVNRHASDGRIMPPGAKAVVGGEAIREFWTGLYQTEGLSLTWGPDEAHVTDSGDMGYVVGHYRMTLPDGTQERGKTLVVWVKEDGEWRIAADMFSSNLSPS